MPWTYGDGEIAARPASTSRRGRRAARRTRRGGLDDAARRDRRARRGRVGDGATLQLGIGAGARTPTLPGLVARRGLRVWTEMFSDGVLALGGPARWTGTAVTRRSCSARRELYDWVDRNPRVRMLRTERTNNPARIAAQPADDVASTPRCRSTCSARPTPRGSTPASTPASAARPTSSSARCTPPAARRSWPCGPGTPRRTCRPRRPGRRAGDVVPAHGRRHRAGRRRVFGHDERSQARAADRERRPPAGPRGAAGGGGCAGTSGAATLVTMAGVIVSSVR